MSAHRDIAIVAAAALALFGVYGAHYLVDKPVDKGNRIVALPAAVPPKAEQPAAMEPPVPNLEPVAAGPAPAEITPPKATVSTLISKPAHRKHKRKIRRAAKPDPCVGPLCALVTARR